MEGRQHPSSSEARTSRRREELRVAQKRRPIATVGASVPERRPYWS